MTNLDWLLNLSLSEINLVNTYVAEKSDYPMKNNGRRHYGFLYTIEGEETYIFADKIITAVPSSVVCIPKGEEYTIEFKGEKSTVISFDFEIENEVDIRPFIVNIGHNSGLKAAFSDAEYEWRKKAAESYTACKSFFYKILSMLIHHENHYCNTQTYSKISNSVLYLHANYLEPSFKIEKLALLSRMSPRYFEMLFASVFKMTPKEYVIHLKLSLAKELLLNEKNTVTGIATQLGFNDVYHFSRTFKAKTGYTPTQYKHNNTEMREI